MQLDSELIRLASEGQREAYGELAKRYERLAWVVAIGILSDRHLAEDAVQEAFVSAYRRLDSLRDGTKFGAWLTQITRREAIRLARRQKDSESVIGRREPVDEQSPDAALNGHEMAISWINRLPAIREYARAATKLEKGSSLRQTYTFNPPIASALFDMTPPKDYRLVSSEEATIGPLPKPELPAKGLPPGPTLKPGIGIGEVTFGMTAEQIVETLGKADRVSKTWTHTPEESRLIDEAHRKARKLDKFEGQRLIDEAEAKVAASVGQREPDAARMEYDHLGIEIDVSSREGLVGGFCWPHGHGDNYPYTGKTTEGIGLGSTMAEIEQAYGPPDGALARKVRNILKGLRDAVWEQPDGQGKRKRDSHGIWYESRGLHFVLAKGKVRYIVFNRGIDR